MAYQDSLFYRNFLKEQGRDIDNLSEWEDVPIIQKKDMVMAKWPVVLPKYCALQGEGKLFREYTSGSTGQCLEIYWSKRDSTLSLLPLWLYRRKYYGINTADRFCYFYTLHNPYGDEPQCEANDNSMGFSKMNLTQARLEEIYQQMYDYDPVWLMLQPSIAIQLARYIFSGEAPLLPSLRYVELTGEMLTAENKRFLEAAFECPCANQYGSYEVNSMAYECPAGHLHVMEENVYLEIIKDGRAAPEGEEGEIVVTSLRNRVMPFIRYTIGDYGKVETCQCPYHQEGKILTLTRGRKNDLIFCPDGEYIHAYELIRPFGCISERLDGRIFQYQLEQTEYDKFTVHIVTDERAEDIEAIFYETLQNKYLKGCDYTFVYHDSLLPEERTGKLRLLKSLIKKEDG